MPNLDGKVDWAKERGRLRDRLTAKVAGLGYPVGDIEVERFVDPTDWERMGMARGTPFALAHDFFQTGPFRPGNVDRQGAGRGVRRLRHRPRAWACPWSCSRDGWPPTGWRG